MKKSPSVKRRILRALEVERFERRLTQKRKQAEKSRTSNGSRRQKSYARSRRHHSWDENNPWVDLSVPIELDLATNRDETCDFVMEIRARVKAGSRIRLRFDDCLQIKLAALVLLLAQMHKLRLQFGADRITGTYPKNERVERLLTESGFYSLLQVKSRSTTPSGARMTRFIRFKSDQKPNSSEIPKLRIELLGADLKMPATIGRKIFRALSEAMTNVNHHAYKTKLDQISSVRGRWWMVANISLRTKMFTLAFYDSGVGIPRTLTRKYPIELVRSVLSLLPGIQPDDGQMIRAAMELGRSRTNQENRGKGLMDLARLINDVDAGEMKIHSRQGVFTYRPNSDAHENRSGFVEGTLIEWQLPLHKALELLPEELKNESDT